MKNFLITILLLSAATCVKLQVGSQVVLQGQLALNCADAQGDVAYDALNLPQGVTLQNGKLVVLDQSRVRSGNYPVRIRVQDATGAADERVIVITIRGQNGANSVSVTNNAAFGVSSGERTITLTQTTRNNIRSGDAGAAGNTGASGVLPGGATNPTVARAPVEIPQPDSGVNTLLDSLQVPVSFESGSSPAGAPGSTGSAGSPSANYPAFNFPTGGNPDIPNYTPLQIAGNQAQRTPVNRNPITADDVKSRVIFDRQLNAAKALGNLLSIVKQATANKNEAQDEITKRQQIYNDAVNRQRDVQGTVTKAENDVNRVKQGITQLSDTLAALQKKQNDLNDKLRDLNSQKDAANSGIQSAQNKLNDVKFQIDTAEKNLNNDNELKRNRGSECTTIDREINNAQNDRASKAADADALARNIQNGKDRVNADNQKVNDLIAQLDVAKNNLANSQKNLNDLLAEEKANNAALNDLTRRVDDLKSRKTQCANDLNDIDNKIRGYGPSLPQLRTKKQNIEDEIRALNAKVNGLNNEISTFPAQLKEIDSLFSQVQKNLSYLRSQFPIFLRIQNDAYANGNAANDAVKAARENLDAATKRFVDENKIIEEATRNIELARVQKDQSDLAVEALLKDGAGILPYAAAPGGENTLPLPNPDANGAFPIKSWVDFITQGFGVQVKPYFVGDLNTLYSFKLPGQAPNAPAPAAPAAPGVQGLPAGVTLQTLAGITPADVNAAVSGLNAGAKAPASALGEGICAGNNLKSISGFVVGVAPGSIKVLDGSNSFTVSYAGCTKAYASRPNYNIAVGDVVLIKGIPHDRNILATQVACVAAQ